MQHAENPTLEVDKSAWGEGPWQHEPDKEQWITGAGLDGLIVRHPAHGHLCGYVGVPAEHPLYEVPFKRLTRELGPREINYSEKCAGDVCHIPEPGRPDDVWWLGFDCAQGAGLSPGMEAQFRALGLPGLADVGGYSLTYRTIETARELTEQLALQLKMWENPWRVIPIRSEGIPLYCATEEEARKLAGKLQTNAFVERLTNGKWQPQRNPKRAT